MSKSATDELRALLDARGVEWDYGIGGNRTTMFRANGVELTFVALRDGVTCTTILTPEQAVEATLGALVTGDTSDGFHTFNELYHHRAVLFSVIVRDHRELAWKSKAHHDGTMYDGMFIVGIETPQGQATYHYDIDPYWDMFDCKELDRAPEWDGHTPDEAIERIATLVPAMTTADETERIKCRYVSGLHDRFMTVHVMECGACGRTYEHVNGDYEYCPHCIARIVREEDE